MSPALQPNAEIAALVLRARAGDVRARDRIVFLFQTWVHWVLRRVVRARIPDDVREDLEQEAQLGLLRAIELYDPKKARFSTYSFLWIRAFIYGWFRKDGGVHVRHKAFWAIRRGLLEDEDIARENGMDLDEVSRIRAAMSTPQDYENYEAFYQRRDEGSDEERCLNRVALQKALAEEKDERDRAVLEAQLEGDDNSAIGKRLGLSRERVRQIGDGARERVTKRLHDGPRRK